MTEPRDCPVTGKIAYASWGAARLVALTCNRRRHHHVEPYRCRFCHLWHLGRDGVKKAHRRRKEYHS